MNPSLIIIFTLLVLTFSGCSNEKSVKNTYYEIRLKGCNNLPEYEKWWCITSVKHMEVNNFEEVTNGKCKAGFTMNMNKTMGSKQWCEPAK